MTESLVFSTTPRTTGSNMACDALDLNDLLGERKRAGETCGGWADALGCAVAGQTDRGKRDQRQRAVA